MRNQTVWALQHRCKQETKRFGSCNIVANEKPNGLGLATMLQRYRIKYLENNYLIHF